MLGAGVSEKLRRRRLEVLPLTGPGAAFTELQGRGPGESTSSAALADLISSIGAVGVLQPVLIEEITEPGGRLSRLIIAGERRLRACRWGAVADPDNPHFQGLPAVICPGPLTEDERRTWQLIENLAREDLQPGELAAALLLERCALLAGRLRAAGVALPSQLQAMDDPVSRWTELERSRTRHAHNVGASWEDTLRRLGLQIQPRRARQLVEAFRALPRQLSSDMDAARVSLTTRCAYARLHQGRREAAADLWAAVQARRSAQLLPRAVHELTGDDSLTVDAALDQAQQAAEQAHMARAAANRRPPTTEPASVMSEELEAAVGAGGVLAGPRGPATSSAAGAAVDEDLLVEALRGLRRLTEQLRGGARLGRYDAGSLVLAVDDLVAAGGLDGHRPQAGDGHRRGRDQAGRAR